MSLRAVNNLGYCEGVLIEVGGQRSYRTYALDCNSSHAGRCSRSDCRSSAALRQMFAHLAFSPTILRAWWSPQETAS